MYKWTSILQYFLRCSYISGMRFFDDIFQEWPQQILNQWIRKLSSKLSSTITITNLHCQAHTFGQNCEVSSVIPYKKNTCTFVPHCLLPIWYTVVLFQTRIGVTFCNFSVLFTVNHKLYSLIFKNCTNPTIIIVCCFVKVSNYFTYLNGEQGKTQINW
jgi:hypothetical protein